MNVTRTNLVARVSDQERTHHSSNRSARTQIGNGGVWVCCNLRKHRDYPTGKIEGCETPGVHSVVYLRAERPKVCHVADNVRPACMHEHGRQDCDQAPGGPAGLLPMLRRCSCVIALEIAGCCPRSRTLHALIRRGSH